MANRRVCFFLFQSFRPFAFQPFYNFTISSFRSLAFQPFSPSAIMPFHNFPLSIFHFSSLSHPPISKTPKPSNSLTSKLAPSTPYHSITTHAINFVPFSGFDFSLYAALIFCALDWIFLRPIPL